MKNQVVSYMWVLFLTLSSCLNAADNNLASLVIITGNYPPAIDGARSDKGYVAKIVSDAFSLEGITVNFLFLPWARGLHTVRKGDEVAIMYYAKTQERAENFLFSDALFEEEWVFFHLKKNEIQWKQLTDLSKFNIGATLSYSYSEEFHELAKNKVLNVNWVTRDKQNWQMLMNGRIDIFPNMASSKHQLDKLFQPHDIAKVTFHKKPLAKQLNYLLFSKKHSDSEYFKNKFNLGFSKLKKLRPISYYIPNTENKTWPE